MKLKPLCLAVAVVMTGCGGGGGGDSKSTSPTITPEPTTTLSGSAVKGPLVNAVVRAYALDTGAADLKGTLLGSGSTDAQAAISGLAIPAASSGPVLLEILADVDTVDLTTGATPVITRMVTVRDAAELMAGKVYATPLTTMVVELARTNGDKTTLGYGGNGDSSLSTAEFLAALPVAQAQVKSSLGFGLVDDVDLLAQSPLITGDTADAASQNSVLAYRTAIEGIAAIAEKLKDDALAANAGSSVSTDDMFAALAADLSDGTIDGQDANGALPAMADLADVGAAVTVDPATLMIPGTTTPLTEVSAVLIAEKADTGISTDTTDIENAQTAPAVVVVTPDSDGDGVNDLNDVFPLKMRLTTIPPKPWTVTVMVSATTPTCSITILMNGSTATTMVWAITPMRLTTIPPKPWTVTATVSATTPTCSITIPLSGSTATTMAWVITRTRLTMTPPKPWTVTAMALAITRMRLTTTPPKRQTPMAMVLAITPMLSPITRMKVRIQMVIRWAITRITARR